MNDVLCVDDDAGSAEALSAILRDLGHGVHVAVGLDAALMAFDRREFGAVIVSLPLRAGRSVNGHGSDEAIAALQARANDTPLLALTGHWDPAGGVAALEQGVLDYLTRPVRREALRLAVTHAIEVGRLRVENRRMRGELGVPAGPCDVIGRSEALRAALATLTEAAGTPATVLIEGEPGTGKSLLARAVHAGSPRRDQPLLAIHCGFEPEAQLVRTLFGRDRRAAAGEAPRFPGAFERARRGTLVLEEISGMDLALQAQLARVLRRQDVRRMSIFEPADGDVRVVATSRRELAAEVEAGRFHRELYEAMPVRIRVPALRERREDVPLLVAHFLRNASRRRGVPAPRVPEALLAGLAERPWPGNVRELEEILARASASCAGSSVWIDAAGPIPGPSFADPVASSEADLPINLRELERKAIERALCLTRGNRLRASRLLGITDRTLRNKLRVSRTD